MSSNGVHANGANAATAPKPRARKKPVNGGPHAPHEPTSEDVVIGGLLIDPSKIADVRQQLDGNDFVGVQHGIIFRTLCEMQDEGTPIDCGTVATELAQFEDVFEVHGLKAIMAMLQEYVHGVMTTATMHLHVPIIRRAAIDRIKLFGINEAYRLSRSGDADAAVEAIKATLVKLDERATGGAELFPFIQSKDLGRHTEEQPYLITGFLAQQPGILSAPEKAGKTLLCTELAVAASLGLPVFGKFETPRPLKIAFMSAESGESTITRLAQSIAVAKGASLDDCNVDWCFRAPDLTDATHRHSLRRTIDKRQFDLMILDPTYLMMPGVEMSNVFAVGGQLAHLTRIFDDTGCAFLLVNHNRKTRQDRQFAVPEMQNIAYSGFSQWMRQWILLERREAYNPESPGVHRLWMNFGGSAGHSGLYATDINEWKRDFDGIPNPQLGREWSIALSPPSVARQEKAAERDEKKEATRQNNIRKILAAIDAADEPLCKEQLKAAAKLNTDNLRDLLPGLVADGVLETTKERRGQKPADCYRRPA